MKTLHFKIRKVQIHASESEKKKTERAQPSRVYVSEEALIELTGSKDGGRPVIIEKTIDDQHETSAPPTDAAVRREATLWKAPQRLDKGVMQIYDAFCDACNLRLGDHVRITAMAPGSSVPEAFEVVLEDVTATAVTAPLTQENLAHWEFFLAGRLDLRSGPPGAEAIHVQPGLTLKDTVLRGPPRSFRIVTVNQSTTSNAQYIPDKTLVKIQEKPTGPEQAIGTLQSAALKVTGLRGRDAEVTKLNQLLRVFTDPQGPPEMNGLGLLIHGGHGTGKTMLLDRLVKCGWGTVFQVQFADKLSVIQETFQRALAQRPSLIVMDELEKLIHKDRSARASIILAMCRVFDDLSANARLKGEPPQVVIVATCLDPVVDVPAELREAGRFAHEIFLPTLDITTRRAFLQGEDICVKDDMLAEFCDQLSERTHAYNGKDLQKLVDQGRVNWKMRVEAAGMLYKETYAVPADYWNAMREVRPSVMSDISLKPPPIRWSDIGGQDDVKMALRMAVEYLTVPRSIYSMYFDAPSKGILLYGPPGCSKTMTAQAMATEAGFNFFSVKGAELLDMYVGETERKIRELFRRARDAMPSMIFFDEFDAIAGTRSGFGKGSTGHSGPNALTTLLTELDGFENLEGVLVLAATNRPDALDPALLRPGRFDKHFYVQPPDETARRAIFANVKVKRGQGWAGIDVDHLARLTDGFSGSEVMAICTKAGEISLKRYTDAGKPADWPHEVIMADLTEAIREQSRGITQEMLDGYARWGDKSRR